MFNSTASTWTPIVQRSVPSEAEREAMKEITLTRGKVTLVDDEDYDQLRALKWHAIGSDKYGWYAACIIHGSTVEMHRFILGRPAGMEVDHVDRNGLNNTRNNLRLATHAENMRNRCIARNNTSGFKGVHWNRKDSRRVAQMKFNGQYIYLSYYCNAIDAARAYDSKASELYGEFARLNFPNEILSGEDIERTRVRRNRRGR